VARRGESIDPGVSHRSLLHLTPDLRPLPDSSFFDRIGGQATVDRLVDSLYDHFEADAAIRPLFGRDLDSSRNRQKRFFCEWLGGPHRYSESAWGGLYQHHEDLPITAEVAERWLQHLSGALDDAVSARDDAARILERARVVAFVLVNSEQDPNGPTGTSKHRSQRVASCGVGARTIKRAELLAQRGKVDELAILVAEISDVVERVPFAAQLLQGATLAGRIEVVEWLLDTGVDANIPWPLPVRLVGGALELVLFVTPLCAARMTRRSEIGAVLLRRGAKEDVFTAAFLGDVPRLEKLLSGRPFLAQVIDPATDVLTITPIHHSVAGNQVSSLQILLDHTSSSVRAGARALRAAAERSSREMIELLLEHGADAGAVGAADGCSTLRSRQSWPAQGPRPVSEPVARIPATGSGSAARVTRAARTIPRTSQRSSATGRGSTNATTVQRHCITSPRRGSCKLSGSCSNTARTRGRSMSAAARPSTG
jgi:hemoglobin